MRHYTTVTSSSSSAGTDGETPAGPGGQSKFHHGLDWVLANNVVAAAVVVCGCAAVGVVMTCVRELQLVRRQAHGNKSPLLNVHAGVANMYGTTTHAV